jgi:hypothetical protein
MKPIYTVTVKINLPLQVIGGRLMTFDLHGETTCRFTEVEEAQRFVDLITEKGHIADLGIELATVESAQKQVEKAIASMGNCIPGARVKLTA